MLILDVLHLALLAKTKSITFDRMGVLYSSIYNKDLTYRYVLKTLSALCRKLINTCM